MSFAPDPTGARAAPADRPATHEPQADADVAAGLDAADAALVAAVTDDRDAPLDLDDLLAATGATRALLEAVGRAGLLLPHHVDEGGTPRYSQADVRAVRAGLALLDAGLPLGELLDLARRTDAAIGEVAEHAVEAFLRFVRDPVRGTAPTDEEAAGRLVTAYERMLPATEQLVVHHLRRRLVARAAARVMEELHPPADGPDAGAEPDRDAEVGGAAEPDGPAPGRGAR